jgi:type II secretory pathway predicted ATPase ExeA
VAEHVARLDAEGRFAVVVVDEAQLLAGRAAFDELRLLTNLAADDRALVGVVLVGQPELRERIRARGGEAFAQRIGVAYHVGALDREETGCYLAHRLAVAGRATPLFEGAAVEAVHRHSGGLPRRVNQLAASALLEGFAQEAPRISAGIVEAAAADMDAYMGTAARAR